MALVSKATHESCLRTAAGIPLPECPFWRRACVCIGGTFESTALATKEITDMDHSHAPDHWLHNPIGRLSIELLWLLPLLFVAIVASVAAVA
jgi:hypothetical protein